MTRPTWCPLCRKACGHAVSGWLMLSACLGVATIGLAVFVYAVATAARP